MFQMKMIRKGLSLDATTRRNIALLRFISATSLILVSFRRRLNKIPELKSLLAPLQSKTLTFFIKVSSRFKPIFYAFTCFTSVLCFKVKLTEVEGFT